MNANPPDPDNLFGQYDSFEDPESRSEFLDAMGTTRPHINAQRSRYIRASHRSAASEPDEVAPQPREEAPASKDRKPRPPRLRKRSSRTTVTTRPPNNTGETFRSRQRRRRERPARFLVIIIRLD